MNITLKEQLNNGASIFTFEYPRAFGKRFANGSTVIFRYGGADIFYGFLFKTRENRERYACTAYDQLRYLKAKWSVTREAQTLSSFVNDVCANVMERIRLGTIDSTEFVLGKKLFDNKTFLDMLYDSIGDNLVGNGYHYCLRDEFGAIALRDLYDLRLPLVIGDESLAYGYEYTQSIDEDTYNYIKVAKDDKDAGVRDTYVVSDNTTIAKWGKLILYEKVSANLNDAQLAERAKRLLDLKNSETQTLSLECIGDTRVHAGNGIKVEIEEAELSFWAVVESVTHSFGKQSHTMKLNLMFGGV